VRSTTPRWLPLAAALAVLLPLPAGAQEAPAEPVPADAPEPAGGPSLRWGVEVKAAYRDSDANRFAVPFSLPGVPPFFLETVDPGGNVELANVALFLDAVWGEALLGHLKVDIIDLWDRNPTSTDQEVDVDEAWLRLGRESEPGMLPERAFGGYVKLGKLPKFERQDDRHLESYGLASTAFNRFEDLGVELGLDLGRHLYLKASYTQGNPLFLRDPNALAGDNGTESRFENPPRAELGSGVPILYDAEVEELQGEGHQESGAGLGLRFGNADGSRRFDVMAWGFRRSLADRVQLEGTRYGGDLDLLGDPADPYPGLAGDEKQEVGANLWLYLDGLSLFAQYVDQEVASLPRVGYEAELAWRFELPLVWAVAGQQLFPSIAPAVRFSKLEPDFLNPARTPVPSFAWEWEKIDAGLRIGITPGTDLTVEYAQHRFLTARGWRDNDELLSTLRWRM
jgi:hypothetical protein